ncbi:hypothetical protein [Bradyrhizobium pachyrhizi]|nr:hypothetical protein [Bradyrhizobium pachyrhizi]
MTATISPVDQNKGRMLARIGDDGSSSDLDTNGDLASAGRASTSASR